MKICKITKFLDKGEYEKARKILTRNQNKFTAEELYSALKKRNLLEDYQSVKIMVDLQKCKDEKLIKNFTLFDMFYKLNFDLNAIENLVEEGASLSEDFSIQRNGTYISYRNCLYYLGLANTKLQKDILFICMKNGCYIGESNCLNNFISVLKDAYSTSSLDFKEKEKYINHLKFDENEIKDFARAARYGIIIKIKECIKKEILDKMQLIKLEQKLKQIEEQEFEWINKIYDKKVFLRLQKEESTANTSKSENLIVKIQEEIEQNI